MALVVLVLSIVMQLAAAGWAIRLVRLTGRRMAWLLISGALLLMAGRRLLTLSHTLSQGAFQGSEAAELVALAISVLMFAGVGYIDGYFRHAARSDHELREREELFRLLFERGGEGNLLLDGGVFVDCNEQACRMLGLGSKAELLGRTPAAISPDLQPDGEPSARKAAAIIARGLTEGSLRFEWDHRRSDGSVLPVEVVLTAIPLHGRTILHTAWRDISARRRAEQALRESIQSSGDKVRTERRRAEEAIRVSDTRFRFLFDTMSQGVMFQDRDGHILSANPAAERILGVPADRMLGYTFADPLWRATREDGSDIPASERPGMVALRTGEEVRDVVMQIHNSATDSARWIAITAVPQYLEGAAGPYQVYSMFTDVTAFRESLDENARLTAELEDRVRIRTSELEEANREMEAFTYSISHDLQAPVRAIDGFTRALAERHAASLPAEGMRYIELLTTSVRKMQELIEALLLLSRTGRARVTTRTVDATALVHDVLEDLRAGIEAGGITVTVDPLPPFDVDPTLMKQVYHNLLSNAVKFTARTAEPAIRCGCIGTGPGRVYFVRDNGIGFDPAHADRLFGAFQRFHRQEDYPGTGVGLAIVQRIIRRHDGWIWGESEPGQGASFYFHLHTRSLPDGGAS